MARCLAVRCGMAWYGMVWCGTVRFLYGAVQCIASLCLRVNIYIPAEYLSGENVRVRDRRTRALWRRERKERGSLRERKAEKGGIEKETGGGEGWAVAKRRGFPVGTAAVSGPETAAANALYRLRTSDRLEPKKRGQQESDRKSVV